MGVVAIGRNEGERFARCIASILATAPMGTRVVYVDSGSTDGSQDLARGKGVEVVELDMQVPFTAARARNAGLDRLLELEPGLAFVQFIDGDCEVREGWLAAGVAALQGDATIGAVSGRLRERFPERTLYNKLADLEWERPAGEEKSCGGVAMMRVEAVVRAGTFDAGLIAGEEPELCARMRALGFRVVRIAHEMAWHDMAMTRRDQWLTRARRHGHAIIEVSWFKGAASKGLFASQMRSALVWGLAAPVLKWALLAPWIVIMSRFAWRAMTGGSGTSWKELQGWGPMTALGMALAAGCVGLAGWLQTARIARTARRRGVLTKDESRAYAALLMKSKRANVRGMVDFLWKRMRGERAEVISFKEG